MLKRIPQIDLPRMALGLCLLALALCLWPSQSAWAQDPASGEPRYCTWLFWSKEPVLIKQALERMALGDPFMVVAREVARRNPKDSQANADCMQASGMDPAVLAIVKNLKIGEISRPFDLGGGTALVMRTTDEHRRKAQEFYSKGRYSQAERELLRDLKLHPASSAAWHMLALTRTAQGNYKQALDALNKALVWSPGNPAMLNDKASALANLGQSKEAVPVFEKALKLDPKNPTIMSNLAWALTLARKDPKQAQALAKQACQEAPQEARFWHTLGKVQAAQGKHGEAVASFRQALVLSPASKAASRDMVKSIKALDPKVLARLSQNAPPPAPAPKPVPKPKDKADEIGKGLKPAPDMAGPAIALPSQWPALPKAEAGAKQEPEAKTAANKKNAPETQAKAGSKAEPPAKPSSGASGRIVSLPMPKFPEPPPDKAKDEEPTSKDQAFKESPKPAIQTKAAPPPSPAKADSQAKQAKAKTAPLAKPKAMETKPELKKSQAKTEPANSKVAESKSEKAKAHAKAKTAPAAKPKAAETKPEPAKADPEKPASKPAEKPLAKAAPPKPTPSKPETKAPAKAESQKTPTPSKEVSDGTPHYLIQVASYRPESLAKKELIAWQRRKIAGHIETWQDKQGRTWHRVLLGPFADQKEAETKAEKLKAKRLVRDYYVVKRPAD